MSMSDRLIEILKKCEEVESVRRGPGDEVYFKTDDYGVTEKIVNSLKETNKGLGYKPTANYREWHVIQK